MRKTPIAFAFGMLALAGAPNAIAASALIQSETPSSRQYGSLPTTETADLIAKIVAAQNKLRVGEDAYFQLLTGAPASYPMTMTAPREAFLAADFSEPFSIERLSHCNSNWKPYRLILTPDGVGNLLWDVKVVLGSTGRIEKVQMLQRPPHPF